MNAGTVGGRVQDEAKTLGQLQAEHFPPPRAHVDPATGEAQEQSVIRNYVRDLILGFNDGVVSVYALVAGLVGGGVRSIGIVGVAAAIAGALSMGIGEYLSTKSQSEYYDAEAKRERQHIRDFPALERQELREMLEHKRYPPELIDQLVGHISGDEHRFVDFMMREEFGVGRESHRSALAAAGVIMAAFLVGAVLPVVPFFLTHDGVAGIVLASAVAVIGLFAAGVAKATLSGLNVWRSGFEIVLLSAVAASITYGVGYLFHVAA